MENNNKLDFISEVSDSFAGLESDKDIELRAEIMIELVLQQKELAKGYLKAGIL